jgi:uncharacterized membrane protein YkgB
MSNSAEAETNPEDDRNGVLSTGFCLLRYGLAFTLIYVGLLKFAEYEAEGVEKYATNNPLTSWLYSLVDSRTAARVIGIWEIISAVLIALHPRSAKASAVGSAMAVGQFLVTQSFLLTTPGVWQEDRGFPFMSEDPGQFLAKDMLSLAASILLLGEALREN